jgi:DNA primase
MIKINDIYFACELHDILVKLQMELHAGGSRYLAKMKIGPTHIQVTCPYHSDGVERKPSAGIRKEDGLFHCFACNEVHSLPEVISRCFEKDDGGMYGMQWLLRNFSATAREENRNVKFDISRNKKTSDNNRLDIRANNYISNEELEKYRYIHPYLYKRGMTDEIIELFDIGYDRDMQAITFPVRDIHGNCLFIARRSVKTKFFNYPEGVEKPLYGLYEYYKDIHDKTYIGTWAGQEITSGKYELQSLPVIVCESMLDALSFWTVGKYAVALNGLGNELQFQQLRNLPCRQIILATDMDERGMAARDRIRDNMQNTKIVGEYFFPKGCKDANDCTKEQLKNLQIVY